MASAGQDHHDWPLASFTVGTLKVHQGSLGSVGGTAAAVRACSTVARLVCLDTGAVFIGEVDGCVTSCHPLTLAASL